MSLPSTYKPSPLSFGSPRTSPFRRPESPASPSNTIRPTTPTPSPTKVHTPLQSPSKLQQNALTPTSNDGSWTPQVLTPSQAPAREPPSSPTRGATSTTPHALGVMGRTTTNGDALAKIPPAQVREMREGFQTLDRDNDGQVNREDVVDMLANLGQDSTPKTISQFFAPGAPQTLNMPSFLHTLSSLLAPLSSQTELLNAFAAFDDDDSGQIDVGDLRDALLHTSPDVGERALTGREVEQVVGGFRGRREFSKGMGSGLGKREEVFRYREFVGSVMGGGEGGEQDGRK